MESWIKVVPMSGTGDKEISISSPSPHTGREDRRGTVTVQNQNGAKPSETIEVIQGAASEIHTIDETKPDVSAAGGIVVINAVSNVAGFSVYEYDGPHIEENDITIKINGKTYTHAQTSPMLPDNLGVAAQYNIELTCRIPANPEAKERTFAIEIEPDSWGESSANNRCVFKQLAGTSSLSVANKSISLAAAGIAQNVAVVSNDDWTCK